MNWCCIEYSVLGRNELSTHEKIRRNLKCTAQREEANQKWGHTVHPTIDSQENAQMNCWVAGILGERKG